MHTSKKRKEALTNDMTGLCKRRPYVAWEPRKGKIRNVACACGSGLKYKKCCLA